MSRNSSAKIEGYLVSVSRGRRGVLPALLRTGLAALAPVYCAGLKAYLLPYNLGLRKRRRLVCPVICIGNLTTGGTGKTPMTQFVCARLQAAGKRVVILSRGYGGEHETGCAVVSDGKRLLMSALEAGDEAYLLAKSLPGTPVLVGKDRRVTGERACRDLKPDVILLDDGLQFWQLHRDLDIVLLNACEPFDNGWTFPRGLLREPPSHLRRAGIVVLTNAAQAGDERVAALRNRVNALAPSCPVFTASLRPAALRDLRAGSLYPLGRLEGKRVAALSALGNPAAFEESLEALGAIVAMRSRFRDHHAITPEDLERVTREAREAGVEAVITTEKDAVKMEPAQMGALPIHGEEQGLPILVLDVAMQVDHEEEFLAALRARIGGGNAVFAPSS